MYISYTPSLAQKDYPYIIPICENSIPEPIFTDFVRLIFETADRPRIGSKAYFSSATAEKLCWPRYVWSWLGRRLNRPALASIKAKDDPFALLGSDVLRLLMPNALIEILNEPAEPKVPRSPSKKHRDPNLESANPLLSFFAASKPKRPSRSAACILASMSNPTALDLAPRPVREWFDKRDVMPDCLPAHVIMDIFRFIVDRSLYSSVRGAYEHRYLIHIEPKTKEVVRCSRCELKTIAEHDPRVMRQRPDGTPLSQDEVYAQALLLGYPRRVYSRFMEIKEQTRAQAVDWPTYVYMETGWQDARDGIIGGWDETGAPLKD